MLRLILLLVFWVPGLWAKSRPMVLMFGGFGTSQTQMACWETAARERSEMKERFDFVGFPYPSARSDGASAIKDGASLIQRSVERIGSEPDRVFIIVGHSSGAAVANEVARLADRPERLRLVDLDGFVPSRELRKRVTTSCWAAVNPLSKIKSRNASTILSGCGDLAHLSENQKCQNAWCLHVSLFETSIPARLKPADLPTLGREDCQPNLEWLAGF